MHYHRDELRSCDPPRTTASSSEDAFVSETTERYPPLLMALILFNKPYQVLTAFQSERGQPTLRDFLHAPGFHPAGRLDADSEGLLLLTDDGALQARLSHPRWKVDKTYYAQVEGIPSPAALEQLQSGVPLAGEMTEPALARLVPEPDWLWPRTVPIRFRKHIPTAWLELTIREGRNRQVRRMTAAVGHPTLRLLRRSVGQWTLDGLAPGEWRTATTTELAAFADLLARRSRHSR